MYHLSQYRGTSYEVGRAIGEEFGTDYIEMLDELLGVLAPNAVEEHGSLEAAATTWFALLPEHYQEEFRGIADALGCSIERLLLTYVTDEDVDACTSFIKLVDGVPWVGRNNDFFLTSRWNYVTRRDIPGRLSTLLFGLPGDVFSGTGQNEARLWLHYNWLPALNPADDDQMALEPFVFLREALETCETISDVEHLLTATPRTGGMYLFAVEGQTGQYAALECSCTEHTRMDDFNDFFAATNHYVHLTEESNGGSSGSGERLARAQHMLKGLKDVTLLNIPEEFMKILGDSGVEQRSSDFGTVYSLVANPGNDEVWFAGDKMPSASKGTWNLVDPHWPSD